MAFIIIMETYVETERFFLGLFLSHSQTTVLQLYNCYIILLCFIIQPLHMAYLPVNPSMEKHWPASISYLAQKGLCGLDVFKHA